MNIIRNFFKSLSVKPIEIAVENRKAKQKEMDERFKKIMKATLDGEDTWFLVLKKKGTSCIMKALDECEDEVKHGESP